MTDTQAFMASGASGITARNSNTRIVRGGFTHFVTWWLVLQFRDSEIPTFQPFIAVHFRNPPLNPKLQPMTVTELFQPVLLEV